MMRIWISRLGRCCVPCAGERLIILPLLRVPCHESRLIRPDTLRWVTVPWAKHNSPDVAFQRRRWSPGVEPGVEDFAGRGGIRLRESTTSKACRWGDLTSSPDNNTGNAGTRKRQQSAPKPAVQTRRWQPDLSDDSVGATDDSRGDVAFAHVLWARQ
jgi:hypothetical protein